MAVRRDEVQPPADAKAGRLNLRISNRHDQLLRRAAAAEGRSVSDFVLHSATREAERVLAERTWFPVADIHWDEFAASLDEPLGDVSELADFLRHRPVVELDDL